MKVSIDPFTGKPYVVKEDTKVIERHFGGGGGSDVDLSNYYTKTEADDLFLEIQDYNYFIYNSSGAQTGNRYNDEDDLKAVLQSLEGEKTIQFEQSESLTGAWNFDDVRLKGNGSEYTAGGYTVTFATGATITGMRNFVVESINLRSTSANPVFTTASPFNIRITTTGHLQATTAEFIRCSGAGQSVISCQNSGRVDNDGYEAVSFTGAAFGQTVVLSYGDNTVIENDAIRSTNGQVLIQVLGTVVGDAANFPRTFANFTVGFGLDLKLAFAGNLFYDNTTSGLVAADVQAAIDEIADPTDVYTVSNDSTDRNLDADTATLSDVSDVLATLIKDLQARSIIG